jgi:hypothetical protein
MGAANQLPGGKEFLVGDWVEQRAAARFVVVLSLLHHPCMRVTAAAASTKKLRAV